MKYGKPIFIKIDVEGYETKVLKGLSQPVNYISFILVGYDSFPTPETFTFTTNTGNNTPEIILCDGCCAVTTGNVITASNINNDCDPICGFCGGGQFIVNNPQPFTSLTIIGNGGNGGAVITFCDTISPTPTSIVIFSENSLYSKICFIYFYFYLLV